MKIPPFKTEQFFSQYEFTAQYPLSASDCETISVGELVELAGRDIQQLADMRLGYTESQGHPELRQSIARMYDSVTADDVVFLAAPVEGIYLVMQTLLEPGDEVIALRPAYDALTNVAEHISGKSITWNLQPVESGWKLDFDQLEAMVSEQTRLIVVNFPHNPTGFQPTKQQFDQLVEIARRNNVWLLCDEMYRGLELEGTNSIPSAADSYDRSIVLSGLSKTYGLPGLRAGWLVIKDAAVRDELINWKHYTSICPVATTEWLTQLALDVREILRQRSLQIISSNLELADQFFSRWPHYFAWRRPQAGSVGLVELNLVALGQQNATDYCHQLVRDSGVLLLPGECLGCESPFVRFGFGRRSFPEAIGAYEAVLNRSR